MSRTGMILAAGKGTRLMPLTKDTPKALVKVNGIPMIERVILNLKNAGFQRIIINVHYLADKIVAYLEKHNYFDLDIAISDESGQLLDTGGGVKKAMPLFNEAGHVLVHNSDVITNLDLDAIYQSHIESGALATLAVKHRVTSRSLFFDKEKHLCGWRHNQTGERIITRESEVYDNLGFSGIHVLSSRFLQKICEKGAFSLTPVYLRLSKDYTIQGFYHDNDYWLDIGKPENLKEAEQFLHENK